MTFGQSGPATGERWLAAIRPTNMEICMNWIKVEDAHSRRQMWVNMALATAIREERDLVRISFDKDNIVSTRQDMAALVELVMAARMATAP